MALHSLCTLKADASVSAWGDAVYGGNVTADVASPALGEEVVLIASTMFASLH